MKHLNDEAIMYPFLSPGNNGILVKDWFELSSLVWHRAQWVKNSLTPWKFKAFLTKRGINISLTVMESWCELQFAVSSFNVSVLLSLISSLSGLPLQGIYHAWESCCVCLVETGSAAVALCPHDVHFDKPVFRDQLQPAPYRKDTLVLCVWQRVGKKTP